MATDFNQEQHCLPLNVMIEILRLLLRKSLSAGLAARLRSIDINTEKGLLLFLGDLGWWRCTDNSVTSFSVRGTR